MKRTQIYLDEDLDVALRTAASAEGRSAAALIREAVRTYLGRNAAQSSDGPDPFLELAGKFFGGPDDAALHHDRYLYGPGEQG